ncbi:hypothetical protein Tco_1402384 [Tanacetum coccineum]
MSNQQDIYVIGSETRPPMLNKKNYVPWSSRLLRYAKSRPKGKLIYNSIMNGSYVRQMIPELSDPDGEVPEKKAKLLNEWERFTSTNGESIESYYHHFSKLTNDFKRNKHFPEKIASNLKFLNNLPPEWSRHDVDDLRAERLAKTHDPLALMANSNNPYNYPVFHLDQPSPSTYMKQPLPNNNNYNPQPSFNENYMQQPMPNPKDITDPTTTMNMALVDCSTGYEYRLGQTDADGRRIANQNPNMNSNIVAARAEGNANGNNVRPMRRDDAYLQTKLLIAQKEEAGIQLQAKVFDLIDDVGDLDEIEEVNANYGSAEVQIYDNFYNNDIFNMFTQEEQYTELLEPIPEPR